MSQKTNIIIYFDSSGSMSGTLAPLIEMRDTLLKYALLPLYNYNETLYNEKVSVISNGTERTFEMLNITGDTPDGDVIVMVFQDENSSYGIDGSWNDATAMTGTGGTDLATLRSRLDGFATNYYKGVVFAVEDDVHGGKFDDFLVAVRDGDGLYTGTGGLSDKPEIIYKMTLNDGDTAQYYLDQIIDALSDFGIDI